MNSLFSQTWDFHGEGYMDPSYIWVFGDRHLFEFQNSLYPGLNYQLKGRISLKQITDLLSVSLNFSTGYNPQDQISISIKYKNWEGVFNNNFQESFSYLTLWKKNINGFEIKFQNDNLSLKGLLAKVESTKKQKSFYGNDTQGPYIISDFYLVPGKEKVYLNGRLLERDVDYIIDYSYGILYFTEVISQEDLILIEYEVRGFAPQAYNLWGLDLDYPPFSLTFLNIDDFSSQINRKFIDFSFLKEWGENFFNLSVSQGLLNNIWEGRAYNLNFGYKGRNISIEGESLKVDENYPYFKEILGNFEILQGVFRSKINIDYTPFSFLTYSLNYLREDYRYFYQNLRQSISVDFSRFSLSGIWSNELRDREKDIKKITFNYKEIPISFYIQENKEDVKKEFLKGFSFSSQNSNSKVNLNFQVKDTYTSDILLLNQRNNSFYINVFSQNFNLLFGESYQENTNFKPDFPLEAMENYIADGYQYEFTLTYKPIPESIKVYINNIYVEDGGTFTYYLPSEEPKTYTVEIKLIDKTLQIFFIDDKEKNPPFSGLSILIFYKYLLPEKSYYKRDEISLNLKRDKFSINPKFIVFDDNGFIKRNFSLSLYGELISNLWLNFSFSQYFEENKKNISLNISYRSSPFEFYQGYTYQETTTSLVKTFSFSFKGNISFMNLQGIYNFRESLYSNYLLKLSNFKISSDLPFLNGKLSLSYFNEKRESNQNISSYITSSYSLSYNRNFGAIDFSISLLKEDYSDFSLRWKNLIEIFPIKDNNSKIFFESIYYRKNEKYYHSIRLGLQISFIW